MNINNKLLAITFALGLFACATTPAQYTLRAKNSEIPHINISNRGQSQPIIALRHLSLPGYLNSRHITYLIDDSRITEDGHNRWAEPLSENLRQVIVTQLGQITTNARALAYPLANNIRPEYIIDIQLNNFAAQKNKKMLVVDSNWQLSKPNSDAKTPASYAFNREYPLKDDSIDTLMNSYQQAIIDLTTAIAKNLR